VYRMDDEVPPACTGSGVPQGSMVVQWNDAESRTAFLLTRPSGSVVRVTSAVPCFMDC
jgi:hypothetical protein